MSDSTMITTKSDKDKIKSLRIMLVGEAAVGKSSIMYRYTMNSFSLNMLGTAGIDFKKKEVTVDDTKIKIVLFDTAGQDRFRKIIKNHCKGCNGIVVVYDISEDKSIERLSSWMDDIYENSDDGVEIMLVGNKRDIEPRQITEEQGLELGNKFKIPILETSAKTGDNIDEAFDLLIGNILKKDKEKEKVVNEKELNNIKGSNGNEDVQKDKKSKKDDSIGCKCIIF